VILLIEFIDLYNCNYWWSALNFDIWYLTKFTTSDRRHW